MHTWDPALYLQFNEQRTQPVRDLIARLAAVVCGPARILDVGCGPGNSTALLAQRWPQAEIVGLDSSQEMLAQARVDHPELRWVLRDTAESLGDLGSFDVVFSNAALQWMPDHPALLPRLFSLVRPGGALAVQVPNSWRSPLHLAVLETASDPRWAAYFPQNIWHAATPMAAYYDCLCMLAQPIHLWETEYDHIMQDHEALIEWYRGSGLRPYEQCLPNEAVCTAFLDQIRAAVEAAYPKQRDGRVIFPFRRLFFTASKSDENCTREGTRYEKE